MIKMTANKIFPYIDYTSKFLPSFTKMNKQIEVTLYEGVENETIGDRVLGNRAFSDEYFPQDVISITVDDKTLILTKEEFRRIAAFVNKVLG